MIWDIDPAHSLLSFAIRVVRVTTTRGSFKTLRGRIHTDEQHPANSWVEAEVEAASIDTRNRLRDAHLRSAQFFDVKRYPTMVFRSTHVEQVGNREYWVRGNLTLREITRPITFHIVSLGLAARMGERAHFRASAAINRNDFGVGRGLGVRLVASSLVEIELEVEVARQAVEAREVALPLFSYWSV